MDVNERIARAIGDYWQENGHHPRRITLSLEVSKQLDASMTANGERVGVSHASGSPTPIQDGKSVTFRDVLLVADLDPKYVVDVR